MLQSVAFIIGLGNWKAVTSGVDPRPAEGEVSKKVMCTTAAVINMSTGDMNSANLEFFERIGIDIMEISF